MSVELTPKLIKELSAARNGFYSWDYVAALAAWIIGVEAENERLQARVQELERLLDKANACIGSVVACCTYGSEQAAKTGAYGISPDAFTKIDTYMRTISESNWQPLPQPPKEGE